MFIKASDDNFNAVLEGIRMKTLCYGEKTLMVEFRIKQDAVLPVHSHPHEQTGYLVSGKLQLTVNDKTVVAEAGDSWCIPSDVEHHALALAETIAIEVFSPVREDYLPQD